MSSFFHVLALSRTLATSLETVLTTIALFYWTRAGAANRNDKRKALVIAATSCILRPTGAIIWSHLFFDAVFTRKTGIWLIRDSLLIGFCGIVFATVIDSYNLQTNITSSTHSLSVINFLRVNSSSISQFYGRMPWHYYLTQALPLLCTTILPFFIVGFWKALRENGHPLRCLALNIAWTISVYSLIPHKEWRFIHPLLPIMHLLTAKAMVDASLSSFRGKAPLRSLKQLGLRRMHLFLVLSTLPLSVYVVRYHGRAQIAAMDHLRSISPEELRSVGFLMPCHSTPMQSHLHRKHLGEGRLWAIGCEPPLNLTSEPDYKDQSDVFYSSPAEYLEVYFPKVVDSTFPPSSLPSAPPGKPVAEGGQPWVWNHTWPSHLVFFGALIKDPKIKEILNQRGYKPVWITGNGFEEDPRRRGGIEIWKYNND